MRITATIYVRDRAEWRAWLQANAATARDVWLEYPVAASGLPRIPYAHAVQEALCFGWIDSTVKRLGDDRTAQRFSPRKARDAYSQANIERLRRLMSAGLVQPHVLASLAKVDLDAFEAPAGIVRAIRENERAWQQFQRLPAPYQRIRLAYIESGKLRPGEYEKRLEHFIRMTARGKRFGFGIEDFYDDGGGASAGG
jgi:uncharacterized protein YdeI (YjbR/CyaY-like superfamily)